LGRINRGTTQVIVFAFSDTISSIDYNESNRRALTALLNRQHTKFRRISHQNIPL